MMDKQGEELKYVAGIDGGGSKTACMISDHYGRILSYVITEGSIYAFTSLPKKSILETLTNPIIAVNFTTFFIFTLLLFVLIFPEDY